VPCPPPSPSRRQHCTARFRYPLLSLLPLCLNGSDQAFGLGWRVGTLLDVVVPVRGHYLMWIRGWIQPSSAMVAWICLRPPLLRTDPVDLAVTRARLRPFSSSLSWLVASPPPYGPYPKPAMRMDTRIGAAEYPIKNNRPRYVS
jgi:hypothetical protein